MKKRNVILTCVVFCLVMFLLKYEGVGVLYSNMAERQTHPFGEITDTNYLLQELKFEEAVTIRKVELQFATYAREQTSEVTVEVYADDQLLERKTIYKLQDNAYMGLKLRHKMEEGGNLRILVKSPNGRAGDAATVWIKEKESENSLYRITENGKMTREPGEISMIIYTDDYLGVDSFGIRMIGAAILVFLMVFCIIYNFTNIIASEE